MRQHQAVVIAALLSVTALVSCNSRTTMKELSPEEIQALLGKCAQPRFTERAPDEFYNLVNPLQATEKNLDAGATLYEDGIRPVPCARCHGDTGDGLGRMAHMFNPPPRNFNCLNTIKGVSDGQLFWIIKNGSPGTSMPDFGNKLSDDQIWQIILHVRELAVGPSPV